MGNTAAVRFEMARAALQTELLKSGHICMDTVETPVCSD